MLPPLFACAFGFVWFCCYWSNTDLFSPIKLYLLTLFVCFLDIFLNTYRLEICCIYLGLLLIPLLLAKYESQAGRRVSDLARLHKQTPVAGNAPGARVAGLIWALTLIPVASMAYLISYFGGLTDYLNQLAIRHLAFQGLNTFIELAVNLSSLLTVLYFGIGIIGKRSSGWWICYGLHLTIALAILSMSGSRRSLLMPLVMMLALFHYFRSQISVQRAGLCLLLVLVVASLIGVLRMGQRGAGSLIRDLNDVERESLTAHFKYGLVPLEVVLDANVLNLRYGSTFLAAVTNVIPRPLWPDKPDSAGLAITQDYLGNRWLGASNLNAGFLAESIMNFGFAVGLVFSFIGLSVAMVFLLRRYHRVVMLLRRTDRSVHGVFSLVRYLHIAIAITSLITWETAVVTVPLILNLSAITVIERFLLKERRVPQVGIVMSALNIASR
jgi:hypothetical protein